MLLAMQQDQGVSEAWLDEKKKYFGMPGIRTEQFLAHTLKTVFEGYQVQNLYDSFLFIEDPGAVKSSWRVRLTDQGVITMLNQPQAKKIGWKEALPVGMSDTPIISMEDQIYRMKDMIPLALGMEQEKKRLMLYQAVMSYEKRGIFTWPVIGTLPDFTKESYYECRSEQESAYEVTVLRVMLSMRNATEDAAVLSALFSVVCNQVLQKIFPYHADQIKAGCALADEGRSIFCRVLPDEEYMPPMHCVTVDLIETQESERGLTAVLRRNSADFFLACGAWLKRAKSDSLSMESVMLSYAQKQLGKEPDEYRGEEKLLGLLEEESK